MQRFSQRIGLTPIKVEIQRTSADEALRNALWNNIYLTYFANGEDDSTESCQMLTQVWTSYYRLSYDDIRYHQNTIMKIKEEVLHEDWHKMYDILEFIPNNYLVDNFGVYNTLNMEFIETVNSTLVSNLSAYRFVDLVITEITSDEEISSIEEALSISDGFKPVKTHLEQALRHYSNRTHPDYRNSVKESISSIESLSKIITGKPKATLANALEEINKSHTLHPAFLQSVKTLYGYTSDADGIRHSLLEESDLKHEDAKFMLVTCSAFVNYLISKTTN